MNYFAEHIEMNNEFDSALNHNHSQIADAAHLKCV